MTGKRKKRASPARVEAARAGGRARMAQLRERGELAAFQKAGARAMRAKYGNIKFLERVAEWRRAHPSEGERTAKATLIAAGFKEDRGDDWAGDFHAEYVWEYEPDHAFILDFAFVPERIILEIDGAMHSAAPSSIFYDADRARFYLWREGLLRAAGWHVVHLRTMDLRTDWGASEFATLAGLVRSIRARDPRQAYVGQGRAPADDDDLEEAPF